MKITRIVKPAALSLLCLLVACGPNEEGGSNDEAGGETAENITLEGSSWQLVQIKTTGDYIFTPEDSASYTLQFRSENRLTGKSDCNRITGNWNQQDTELSFEPLSFTRSLCLPGSLHNHFISNLMNVYEFETRDGKLLLATTIPGVMLELEPLVTEEL